MEVAGGVGGEVPLVELSVVIARSPLPVTDSESIRLNQANTYTFTYTLTHPITSHFSRIVKRAKERGDIPLLLSSPSIPTVRPNLKVKMADEIVRGKLLKRETSTFPHSYKYKQYLLPLSLLSRSFLPY